jgi:hypothetical protein
VPTAGLQDLTFSQRWLWRILSSGIKCRVVVRWKTTEVSEERALLATCFHSGFLLGLFFDPEHEGDMFLRNVGWLSTDYTVLYPRTQNSLQRSCHFVDPYCWQETKCPQETIHNVQFLDFSTKDNLASRITERTCRPKPTPIIGPRRAHAPSRYSLCNRQRRHRVRRSIPRTECHLVIRGASQQRIMDIKLGPDKGVWEYFDTGAVKRGRKIVKIT